MTSSRRQFLGSALAAAAVGASRRVFAGREPAPARGPRYVVLVFLSGGVDPIYSLDPREPSEVAPQIDVPYAAGAITTSGNVRLGPHFAALAPWAAQMAVVRGVRLHTANHPTGTMQMLRCRTDAQLSMPTLFDLIGRHRDDQPLGCVTLGPVREDGFYSSGWFGSAGPPLGATPGLDLFDQIERTDQGDRRVMARWLRELARAQLSGPDATARAQTQANLAAAASLFERIAPLPAFVPAKWADDALTQEVAANAQRLAWLLEHDLTRCIVWQPSKSGGWDTHSFNADLQKTFSLRFADTFARLLKDLEGRSNRHGRVLDQTLFVVGSEIGRFPFLNRLAGKDHFPEAPYLFLGAGVNTQGGQGATYGQTGRNMEATATSLRTGRQDATGRALELDDIGTTLLHLAGVAPERFGYRGRVLEFLLG